MQIAKIEQAEPGISLGKLANDARERAGFLSLAKTQKRLSWTYYRWALEAERVGRTADHFRYRAESDRLRRDARSHIELARRRLPNA